MLNRLADLIPRLHFIIVASLANISLCTVAALVAEAVTPNVTLSV